MEEDSPPAGQGGEFLDGLDAARLVIGRHDTDQERPVRDGRVQGGRIDDAVPVHREEGYLEAVVTEPVACVKHRVVLDGSRDQMPPPAVLRKGKALYRKIIRFSPA